METDPRAQVKLELFMGEMRLLAQQLLATSLSVPEGAPSDVKAHNVGIEVGMKLAGHRLLSVFDAFDVVEFISDHIRSNPGSGG